MLTEQYIGYSVHYSQRSWHRQRRVFHWGTSNSSFHFFFFFLFETLFWEVRVNAIWGTCYLGRFVDAIQTSSQKDRYFTVACLHSLSNWIRTNGTHKELSSIKHHPEETLSCWLRPETGIRTVRAISWARYTDTMNCRPEHAMLVDCIVIGKINSIKPN